MIPRNLFFIAALLSALPLAAAPTHIVNEAPTRISHPAPGVILVDFGRVAFGNLHLRLPKGAPATEVTVRFGEDYVNGHVNSPAARHCAVLRGEGHGDGCGLGCRAAARSRADAPRDSHSAEWGVLVPFRWVEIEGWPGDLHPAQDTRRSAFASTWDDAAAFASSDALLDRVWEFCRYSIKATTFAGLYVDGDRERIPYEAHAYLNQLSHYAADPHPQMARDTYDHLMKHGSWPTEWASHMVFIAHADWWQTGDRTWIANRYEALRAKLLLERVGPDGLVASTEKHIAKGDIVDWPKGERGGFV